MKTFGRDLNKNYALLGGGRFSRLAGERSGFIENYPTSAKVAKNADDEFWKRFKSPIRIKLLRVPPQKKSAALTKINISKPRKRR